MFTKNLIFAASLSAILFSNAANAVIGPISAFAELENRIADKEVARIRFLVNIMTPYL